MSPRAAWQLEAMGFEDVYDFVGGKAEWIGSGLPTEGSGPHYPLTGEIARRGLIDECQMGSNAESARSALDASGKDQCVVLNEQGILMGRLRRSKLADKEGQRVEDVMDPGPTTVRPTEPAAKLLQRMQAKDVDAILVTSPSGRYLGVAQRSALEGLVARQESGEHAGQERRT